MDKKELLKKITSENHIPELSENGIPDLFV